MGSYSNYKLIISHSIFNRMALWRTICLQSNIEEVLCHSFSMSISSLWFSYLSYFNVHFLSSNNPTRNSTNNKIAVFLSQLVNISVEIY